MASDDPQVVDQRGPPFPHRIPRSRCVLARILGAQVGNGFDGIDLIGIRQKREEGERMVTCGRNLVRLRVPARENRWH